MGLFSKKTAKPKQKPVKGKTKSLADIAREEKARKVGVKPPKATNDNGNNGGLTDGGVETYKKTKSLGANIMERLRAEKQMIDRDVTTKYGSLVQAVVVGTDKDAYAKLKKKIVSDDSLRRFVTYNNPDVADVFLQDMIGLALIPEILAQYPDATDINHNGRFMTVDTGDERYGKIIYARSGRQGEHFSEEEKAKYRVVNDDYLERLINVFAIRQGVGFSDNEPIFDGFSDNIRINAIHSTLSSVGTTMSLRISRPTLKLTAQSFTSLAPMSVRDFLFASMKANQSLVISGETGTGKTELLKYLVTPIPIEDRIFMIEDVAETQLPVLFPQKDIFALLTRQHENYETGKTVGIGISTLTKAALRNFPRWILVSETRGAEAYELFNAMLNGHAVLTTIHAVNNEAVPTRFINASTMGFPNIKDEVMRADLLRYMGVGVHIELKTLTNGRKIRYADEIVAFDEALNNTPQNGIHVLFKQKLIQKGDMVERSYQQFPIPDYMVEEISTKNNWYSGELAKIWEVTPKPIVVNEPVARRK